MKVLKAYKYRIYPNPSQEAFIKKTFAGVRLVHNLLLQDRIEIYRTLKKDSQKKIKFPTPAQYKKDYPSLKEVDSLALSNAQIHLDRAFKNFHKNKSVGFPKVRQRKDSVCSYTTNNQNGTIKVLDGQYLKVPKLKTFIKIRIHRPITGEIKSATISFTPSKKYFVSLLCEEQIIEKEKTNMAVGITLGTSDFAILSNGYRIDNDKYTDYFRKTLNREERKLARRKKVAQLKKIDTSQSKNYKKQKLKVAKMHEKLMNQRMDFLNKLTSTLVQTYDVICVEDIQHREYLKNQKLNKGITDVSWATFVSKLEYKALWYGKKFVKVANDEEANEIEVKKEQQGHIHLDINKQLAAKDAEVAASIHVLQQGLNDLNL